MQLFKYMNEPRNLFEEGFIRLSQISALNDPFEAVFCEKSLEDLAREFDYRTTFDPDFGEVGFVQYIKLRVNNVGIISLSENKENLLMWSHYANQHKGIVAGIYFDNKNISMFERLFNVSSLFSSSFGEPYSLFDGIPKPVSYRKGLRYRNDKFDFDYSNIDAEGGDRVLYEIFLQKSDEWIYEQEHRIILRLEQADRVIVPKIDFIKNKKIIDIIKKSKNFYLGLNSEVVIDLYEFSDDIERILVAKELSKLSFNPDVLYFMKLSSSSINCCYFGLNCSLNKDNFQKSHACSTGFLDFWQSKRCIDFYGLYFEKL